MKKLAFIFALCTPLIVLAQAPTRPAYCDELPATYEKVVAPNTPLPQFNTTPVTEYKIQVAILKFTHPKDFPFHKKLVARWRPCEQVWVIESRDSFRNRADAEKLKSELIRLGYNGAYIVELMGYE
ncbi:MAG: hypothetical protein KDD02_10185 [Phaeodactylibacter sp.]|nr:hypothetical protein [Phaeodactylibacter sp.]MCB9299436.1 hypothetical protein [Lewinellaceae bacterium]HQU58675.1 hypothetical protein [Saprospiraceae bacterium]